MSGITIDKVRDLAGATDNVNLQDPGGDALDINADGSINVNISGQSNVYAEDSAHTPGADGNFILALRTDTKASSAGTTGDYAALASNASGELYVVDEDGNTLLGTIDADTSLLAGTVSGSELQVDIVAPLPAGTNNIGDVDVLTMPGVFAEDSVAVSADSGMHMLAVRKDADLATAADGDYSSLHVNALGELKVSSKLDQTCNTSVLVTNVTVPATAGGIQLLGSALTGRQEITIQNLGSQDIWVKDGSVPTAGSAGNGFLIPKDSSAAYNWGDNIDLYAITASGTALVKIIECN